MKDFWNVQFHNKMPRHGTVSTLELYRVRSSAEHKSLVPL